MASPKLTLLPGYLQPLHAPRRRATDRQSDEVSRLPKLLEREDTLAQLQALAAQAAQGRGCLAALAGEAGIGKTSVLEAFAQGLHGSHRVHWGGCESLMTARPLGVLFDMADELGDELVELIESAADRSHIFATVHDSLRNASKPTVLIFEDVHWADDGTLDLIKFLGRRLRRLSALLLISYRDDETGRDHPLTRVLGDIPAADQHHFTLAPLSVGAIDTLNTQGGLQGGFSAQELMHISAGNPFFVTELIAATTANAATTATAKQGDKRSQAVLDAAQIPRTVSDAVLSRAARLSAPARAVLEVVSLAPGRMPLMLVRSILQEDAIQGVDQCLERGVLRAMDDGYQLMFRHELARIAIERNMPLLRRQDFHRAILKAMDDAEASLQAPKFDLARRVHHAAGAGDAPLVLALAPQAAQQAAALGAHREAAAQYQAALGFVQHAQTAVQAQLWESWSYEQGLALQIDEAVIEARHQAIRLWTVLGRQDKVGLNLRWLSRLHWYRSEREQAEQYANQAVTVLESATPCAELGMAYSLRSQMHMLLDEFEPCIVWGEKALAAAAQTGNDVETRVHAMTNMGTAMMLSNKPGGNEMLEQSLSLAKAHAMHEHAARVYTNLTTCLISNKQYFKANECAQAGIAFDRSHDLDSWLHYLVGLYADLKFELGEYAECERQATSALQVPRQTTIMRLPAMTVLARLKARRGDADAVSSIDEVLALALPTKEPSRILPLYLARAELAWARQDLAALKLAVEQALQHITADDNNPWQMTQLQLWRKRAGLKLLKQPADKGHASSPYTLEHKGHGAKAAGRWHEIGAPFDEACAWLSCADEAGITRAIDLFTQLGALPALELSRSTARKLGLRGIKRGPYSGTREQAHGLTQRELHVLRLISRGASNADIALDLSRSERTVEHHVSALLAKLGAKNRSEAIKLALRLRLDSQ
jgi:DNA-binding CsgD family transcriptional regulator